MLIRAFAAAAMLLASAPAVPQTALQPTLYSDDTPPVRFRGEAAAIILMVSPDRIDGLCGKAPPGMQTLACTRRFTDSGAPVIIIPNPCIMDSESYAHVLCHEKGHVLGWPADHGA